MDTNLYNAFIRKTIKEEGYAIAAMANRMALERKQITKDQYIQAARIISLEILKR